MKDTEIWKDVIGYEGLYQVSSFGRIKSLKKYALTNERILNPKTDWYGYLQVNLYKDSKRKMFRVHRLVAMAFLGDLSPLYVDHINNVKNDNTLSNLRWVNQRQNTSKKERSNCSSKFVGVSKYFNCWRSTIFLNGKNIMLGYFKSEIEASVAYNKKLLEFNNI